MAEPQKCKILLLGESAVGKTSLFKAFTGNPKAKVTPTIGAEYKQKIVELNDGTAMKVQLWDTAGTQRYRTISPIYYRNLDGVLLIFDITDQSSFDGLDYWLKQLSQKGEQAIIVLVGNKNDQQNLRKVPKKNGEEKAAQLGIVYTEVNTLSQQSAKGPFTQLIDKIYEKRRKDNQANEMQSKRSEFQELRLKDLPKKHSKEDNCC